MLLNESSEFVISKSSGHRIIWGDTSGGKRVAVVWEHVGDNPLIVYPITA